MLVKEYRILCPLEIEEYQRGILYASVKESKAETGGGEGVEVVKQEPFTSTSLKPGETISGTYTLKIYRLKSKMPWMARKLFGSKATIIEEECWDAYPYIKTVLSNPGYMKENFLITVESMHLPDQGGTENALNLSEQVLKERQVVMLDICDNSILSKTDVKPETDPNTFQSAKTGRGPLKPDWHKTSKPVMCCYKVVSTQFKWLGFQSKVERLVQKQFARLFTRIHREIICWIDQWHHLSLAEMRKIEEEAAAELKKQLGSGSLRGSAMEDSDSGK
ncbi:hypothetical protein L596_018235 [Steinernema carpocapsae]|uniref:Phosphatidylinositol transfer protein N-terminal domain-containing protein n=1 Tax=Steinernema carpocapsae TaxID=34508 RepID=A0A4U5N4R9_STECR|nr:hypothetical protein L596_018235 [Steinernema carpocapsae]